MKKLVLLGLLLIAINSNAWAAPTADFSGTPIYGTVPLLVGFVDESTGSITGWLWSFGDGYQSTGQSPTHQYNSPGTYTVSLTVNGPEGSNTETKVNYVTVEEYIPAGVNEYKISIDPAARQKFGLYYPATYKFQIPLGLSSLSAQYRYIEGSWYTLVEESGNDLFNGIDAVRFDYSQGFAYISVGFSPLSDSIYVRVVDNAGQPIEMTFQEIPKYYDNRQAAVVITLDDWRGYPPVDAMFRQSQNSLATRGLYWSVGIYGTGYIEPIWSSVQQAIDQYGDQIEISSHSLNHPYGAAEYTAYGYENEVIGSRDRIRNKLDYPYVPLYVEPYGYSDATLQSWISLGDYLVQRSTDYGTDFAPWDSNLGRYGRAPIACDDFYRNNAAMLSSCNAEFDSVKSAGGIYTFLNHPADGSWDPSSYFFRHMDYLKGRSDVWYVPLGQLYQYHFLQEMRGNLSISLAVTAPPVATFSATPTSGQVPLSVQLTDTSTGSINNGNWILEISWGVPREISKHKNIS